jgi:hypothetical protein
MQEMFSLLFYQYQEPAFSIFNKPKIPDSVSEAIREGKFYGNLKVPSGKVAKDCKGSKGILM